MIKTDMINKIIEAASSAAILQNKHFDFADTFFSLAFMTEENLQKICEMVTK